MFEARRHHSGIRDTPEEEAKALASSFAFAVLSALLAAQQTPANSPRPAT